MLFNPALRIAETVIDGSNIYIFTGTGYIHGVIVSIVPPLTDNGDGTYTMQGQLDYDKIGFVDDLPDKE